MGNFVASITTARGDTPTIDRKGESPLTATPRTRGGRLGCPSTFNRGTRTGGAVGCPSTHYRKGAYSPQDGQGNRRKPNRRTVPPPTTARGQPCLKYTFISDHHSPKLYAPTVCSGSFRRSLFDCQGTFPVKASVRRFKGPTAPCIPFLVSNTSGEQNASTGLLRAYRASTRKRPHLPRRGRSIPTSTSDGLWLICASGIKSRRKIYSLFLWLPAIPLG